MTGGKDDGVGVVLDAIAHTGADPLPLLEDDPVAIRLGVVPPGACTPADHIWRIDAWTSVSGFSGHTCKTCGMHRGWLR